MERTTPASHPKANMKRHCLTQYNSFSGSFILPRSPFLSPPPTPPLWLPLEERAVGGEGRQKMIMQQAAVLHPDAARHTRPFSSFSRAATAPEHTEHATTCTHTRPLNTPTPDPSKHSHIETERVEENTCAPGLTLHYEVCEPVFLSLSLPSLALFLPLLSGCSGLARSQLSSTPRPSPTAGLQSHASSFEGRPTSTNLISIAWLGPGLRWAVVIF